MTRTEKTTLDDGSTVERICDDEGMVRIERIRRANGATEERIYRTDGTLEFERFAEPDGSNVQRRFYQTGVLEAEDIAKDGNGQHRQWHPNGVLAHEFRSCRGRWDGPVRYWTADGELVDSFELKDGSGVLRTWQLDRATSQWHLLSESNFVNGRRTGKQILHLGDGEGLERYWIKDKRVSRKRYFEAAAQDESLPQYPPEPAVRRPRFPRVKRQSPPRKVSDDLPLELLAGPHVREARAWLEETSEPSRSLGAAESVPVYASRPESLKFVKKLYRLGAVAVHAVEIDGAADEDQNSGKLVVQLPDDPEQRTKLLQVSNRMAKRLGFEPDPDTGQRYIFMMLD
jgi:antitoxin component YwqK of YwqJK toxin-antitoxin module